MSDQALDKAIDSLVGDGLNQHDVPGKIIKDIRIMWDEVSLPQGIKTLQRSLDRLEAKGNEKAIAMKTKWEAYIAQRGMS